MNALKEIRKREANYKGANTTRIYNAVVPTKAGECRIDTYAVKTRNKRTGELAIKKVARYYTDRKRYYVRDIIFHNFTHSYLTNWCNEPFGRKHQAVWEDVDACIGHWGYCDRENGTIDLGGDYLNWFEGTKYEHCGWSVNSGIQILDYLDCWRISRGVEFLGKSQLWKLITPSFVRQLSADKGLFNFFRTHLNEIRQHSCRGGFYAAYSISDILTAYRRKCTLAEAKFRRRAQHSFRGYYSRFIPNTIDRVELLKWCEKNDISEMEYCRYAQYVFNAGENITAFGVTMPRNFKTLLEDYERREHEEQMRRRAKEDRRRARERRVFNSGIKSVAEAFAMLSRLKKHGLTVVLPMSVQSLIDEGNAMRNCIGGMGYDEKIAKGTSLIVFLYKDGKPFVDIEIDREHWTVRQCYTKCNHNPEEKVNTFAKFICDKAKAIYRKAA
ncbi:MAG: PcfJ domain-containing protein [Kiritimatiellae bacterium]|nr:PcfJ domain-containing protein [Kiritimatiellia bacterium]